MNPVTLFAGLSVIIFAVIIHYEARNLINTKKEHQKYIHITSKKLASYQHIIEQDMELIKQIYEYTIMGKSSPIYLQKNLMQLLLSETGIKTYIFKNSIDKVNLCKHDIINYISKTYPGLSQSDLEFCSLLCMNFSANAMQFFYSYENPSSYYNKRNRLRTKLKIDSSSTLDTIIREKIKMLSSGEHYKINQSGISRFGLF